MHRRWRGYLARRGRFLIVPGTEVQLAPPRAPEYMAPRGSRPRWPAAALRRGRFNPVSLAAPTPPTARPPSYLQPDSVRWRTYRSRRGVLRPVPPAPVAAVASSVPGYLRQTQRRSAPRVRRGQFSEPAWPAYGIGLAAGVGGSDPRRVAQLIRPRRGQFLAVLPVGVLAGPGPVLPVLRRPALRRGLLPRRGGFFPPPIPVGVLAGAGPVVPKAIMPPRRPLGARVLRRARIEPPWTAIQAVPARLVGRRSPAPLPARRGRFLPRQLTTAPPPGPGPLAPRLTWTRRRYGVRARQGRLFTLPGPVATDRIVHRPGGPIVLRPAGDLVVRP